MSQWSFQSNEVQKNIISCLNNFIFHLPLHSGVAYLTNVTMLSLSAHHPMKSLVLCCPFQSLQSMNVNKEKAWLGRLVKNLPPSEFVIPLTHIHIPGKQFFRRTRPWPAFGRQGLVGSSGRYTSHASPRAFGAWLG